jgi:hypothetical protein
MGCAWARDHWEERDTPNCAGDVISKDDRKYCTLHCPSERKKLKFREALHEKLNDHDYDLRGAWFPEYFSVSAFLERDPQYEPHNRQTDCDKLLNLAYATFSDSVDLGNTVFGAGINLREARIFGKANFKDSVFALEACFSGARFHESQEEGMDLPRFGRHISVTQRSLLPV